MRSETRNVSDRGRRSCEKEVYNHTEWESEGSSETSLKWKSNFGWDWTGGINLDVGEGTGNGQRKSDEKEKG